MAGYIGTYCYRHGVVENGCSYCEALAAQAIRNGVPVKEAYASLFPDLSEKPVETKEIPR